MPPLVCEGGGLVCELVGKADLLLDHFDSKQSRETVDQPLTYHLQVLPPMSSGRMRRLLLDLDPYGGTDPVGMFPLFLKRTANVMSPHLSVVFWRLVRLGSSRRAGDRPISPLF